MEFNQINKIFCQSLRRFMSNFPDGLFGIFNWSGNVFDGCEKEEMHWKYRVYNSRNSEETLNSDENYNIPHFSNIQWFTKSMRNFKWCFTKNVIFIFTVWEMLDAMMICCNFRLDKKPAQINMGCLSTEILINTTITLPFLSFSPRSNQFYSKLIYYHHCYFLNS